MCVASKTKGINVEVFNMTTRVGGAKTLVKHVVCDYKCKCNSTTCNSNQKWDNETCQCKCENYSTCEKDYSSKEPICKNIKH